MRTVYIDSQFRCHAIDDGTMTAVENDFFDGKCATFIEGYRYVPAGKSWTREDSTVFKGEMIVPQKDYHTLKSAQNEYEKAQEEISSLQNELVKLDAAFLDATYKNIIGNIE